MIRIKEVTTRKDRKIFLDFPNNLYKGNPCYVPPLYGDEKKIFSKANVYYDTCESVYFLAFDGKKPVGRISGTIQHASNKKTGERRVRFNRFDCIDDKEVAAALFGAVEEWALGRGYDTVCGPLGFSDLEREGLLIDGFDQTNTFEEQYNYPYYAGLIEHCGYKKDVDWFEYRLFKPKEVNKKIERVAEIAFKRYGLRMAESKNARDFIEKYKDGIFQVLDEGYKELYGTVPFTDRMKKQLIDQFNLIIKKDYVGAILDKDDNVVGFGLCFPAIGDAFAGGDGKLTPKTLSKLFKILKTPKHLDLALVAVLPKYRNLGVNSIVLDGLIKLMLEKDIEYCETNLCLEYNYSIQAQWKFFDHIQHKRRRSYVKKLNGDLSADAIKENIAESANESANEKATEEVAENARNA